MRRTTTVVAALAVLLLVGGVAVASIPDSSGRIFTCVASNGSVTVKDDGGTGSVSCSGTQQQVVFDQYRSGAPYNLRTVQFNTQIPTSYVVGDFQTQNVQCASGEVIVSAGDSAPQDWVLQRVTFPGAQSSQAVFVAVSAAHSGQVASVTTQLYCGKVTP